MHELANTLRNSGWFGILVNDILGMDRIELGTLNYSFMHQDFACANPLVRFRTMPKG